MPKRSEGSNKKHGRLSVGHVRTTLETIIENMPGHVYWKDLQGCYLGCNKTQALSVGLKNSKEIIGKTDFDLSLTKEKAENFRKNDSEVIKSGKTLKFEEITVVNGIESFVISQKLPLIDDKGKNFGILGISLDITELKKTQQALLEQIKETEKAYHSKTEFLSITTHEIRNPVGNITVFNNFMKETLEKLKIFIYQEVTPYLDAEKQKKLLAQYNEIFNKMNENTNIIAHESQKALDYLRNLGELHRLENEGIEIHFIKIKVTDLIDGVIKNTAHYNTKKAEILLDIDPDISEVEIDYTNIYEALQVIFSNALRFSHNESIVKVQVEQENAQLKITVENFGESISASQIQDLLHEEDNRKRNPKTALYRKPSLKLTQAKMKIMASGGKLQIERTKSGTKVTVFAPIKINQAFKNQSKKNSKKKHQILVVEDDINFQKSEKIILEGFGHFVSIASTGTEALDKLSKNTYDLIFLDITLPDMSGIDIIKKIRGQNPNLIIIVVTSHVHKKDIEFFEEVGATLVLTKPVSSQQFYECLDIDFNDDED